MDTRSMGSRFLHLEAIEPTPFFTPTAQGLQQGVDLTLTNDGPVAEAVLIFRVGSQETRVDLGAIKPGTTTRCVYIPDIRQAAQIEFILHAHGQVQDARSLTWAPTRHWEVYLVQRSHHDLGYTDLPSNLLREYDGFMDNVLRYCEQTADWPEESKFRYVAEQGWSILHYLENCPPDKVEKTICLIHEGRIEVTALLGNETSELCSHEEQIRLLYPTFRLKRRFGIPIRVAQLNDVPGLSWGLASVLAGAGIRYFIPGIPDYFAWGYKVHPFWDEEAVLPRDMSGAFWWEGPDGQRVLFWYGQGIGGLWTFEDALQAIPKRLNELAQRGYPFDLLRCRVSGGARDNAPPHIRFSEIAREWNSRWAYPRLIVATNAQFMERFERKFGVQLRVLRGDLPNTDYTVGAASTAKETGINRLTHEALLSAEKLATCATLVSDYPYPADTLAEAYDSMLLYDEHTWGMDHPTGPAQDGCWSQKSQFAYRAAALAHDVLSKSSNRIADRLRLEGEGYHLVVFNPLAWERTDLVTVPATAPAPCGRPMRAEPTGRLVGSTAIGRNLVSLPLSLLEVPFELVDLSSGKSVPYQIVTLDDPLAARPWASYRYALGGVDPAYRRELVFVAKNVPSLGYKSYRLMPVAQKPALESSLRLGKYVLENRYYKVTLDAKNSAVTSIWDKELKREWVDGEAAHGFNQLVVRSPERGEVTLPGRSRITPGERGPVFTSLIVKGEGRGCPRRVQEIILYNEIKRIDFAHRLLKDAMPLLELYLAFPFAIHKPRFRYEASNAVIEPIRDQLPGSNTDAYAMQHWVAAWDEKGTALWSSLEAPVMELGGLWPGYVSQAHHGVRPPGYGHEFLRDPAQLEKGHIYSYIMVNNFRTNFQPVQVADALFRYSLTTHNGEWQRDRASNWGWEVATPLVPVCIVGPQEGDLPAFASFCQVDAPNVHLLTLKAAENGDGLILRLAETEGREDVALVMLPFLEISEAFMTNLVEENRDKLPCDQHGLRVPLRANGLTTVRCRTSRRWPEVGFLARYC